MIKVSVVVPVYTAPAFPARTLESITTQTRVELEIIVVDGGSTDNSYRVVEEFSVRLSSEHLKAKIPH